MLRGSSGRHGLPYRRHPRALIFGAVVAAALLVTSTAGAPSQVMVSTGSPAGNRPTTDQPAGDHDAPPPAAEPKRRNAEPEPPRFDQKQSAPHQLGIPRIEPPSPGPLPMPEVRPVPPGPVPIAEAQPTPDSGTYSRSPDAIPWATPSPAK